jgi:polyisoprenoid-binding protein YceI
MKIIKSLSIILLLSSFMISSQEFELDIQKSNLKWSGKKITNSSHNGSIKFKSGMVVFANDLIKSGKFIVDMTSMNVEDLKGSSKERLEGHLRSDDFFFSRVFQ